jgi:hypothetical protein
MIPASAATAADAAADAATANAATVAAATYATATAAAATPEQRTTGRKVMFPSGSTPRRILLSPPESWYEGQWAADRVHGVGTYRYTNGAHHEGSFVRGERHGTGVLCRHGWAVQFRV